MAFLNFPNINNWPHPEDAREAIKWFEAGNAGQRRAFLTLLLFKPR
jgi:hypothetical protein